MSGRFQIAVHIMTLLDDKQDEVVTSEVIADSLNVNPALARKELGTLIRNNLVCSREGKNGGYRLARPAAEIRLSEIYDCVKPDAILGKAKNRPNPSCSVGKKINDKLDRLNEAAEGSVRQFLGSITLADFRTWSR